MNLIEVNWWSLVFITDCVIVRGISFTLVNFPSVKGKLMVYEQDKFFMEDCL